MNILNILELVIVAYCAVISTVSGIDFVAYAIKSGAKSSVLNKRTWKLGVFCGTILMYWFLNDYNLY